MRVLLVDDDPGARLILRRLLSLRGDEVHDFADGEAALAHLEHTGADVAILDWVLPGISGLELCERIRAAGTSAYTYVLILTSYEGRDRLLEAMDAGADDFLSKPVDRLLLAARLRVAERMLSMHDRVDRLEKLIPICMYSKKVRDEDGSWLPIETFITRELGLHFTHTVSPDSYEEHIAPQLSALRRQRADTVRIDSAG